MNVAAFSPRKLQHLNQSSPRGSARKRSLFPSSSPQTNDLGLIAELYSSDSETYSPPPASPSLSITPSKADSSPLRPLFGLSNRPNLNQKSPIEKSSRSNAKQLFGKENMENQLSFTRKSPRKSAHKKILENEIFSDRFMTVLSNEKDDVSEGFKLKNTENFTTPKKSTSVANNIAVRRSPRSASKTEATIKPVSFYGSNMAPVLAANQTNRIGGVKCVFRPDTHQSRAKTKLNFEDRKPSKKRERSKSFDVIREAKKRKPIFSGVHHAVPKPIKHSSPPVGEKKHVSIREKARNATDLSRTPYGMKKDSKKTQDMWDYTLRFTKPLRYEESPCLGMKRKFFKTSVRESPDQFKLCLSPGSSGGESSPAVPKKRKLLDTRKSYLDPTSPVKPKLNASDIRELIDDDSEKLQNKPELEDILLRLEEDDEEEKRKEAQRKMLMNILEDSPNKAAAIDSLSNCTASLDLNDSPTGTSRFCLEDERGVKETPKRYFSVFDSTTNGASGGKRKWRGVGGNQLQIDAGQKLYGPQQCRECGLLYQAGEAEDEMQHQAFHKSLSVLRHAGWKNEKVVANFGLDYVVEVTSDHPRVWQQKVLEVWSVVDKHLGIMYETPAALTNQKVYMYISEKCVVGCMMAMPVSSAYRLISSEGDVDICSEEKFPAKCGISRMWTLFSHRRQGIASKLLDTVRRNFMYGNILSKEDIAFSIPTPDGKEFAAKYMDSPKFLVYTGY